MSSSDGKSTCGKSGGGGSGKGASVSASNKKECTSCEQKVDEHIKDGASDDTTGSNCNSDIDAAAEGINRVVVDDNRGSSDIEDTPRKIMNTIPDETLFQDPPPKEDCEICMLPMPFASGVSGVEKKYEPCCGKTICEGCVLASTLEVIKGNLKPWCSFCRVPLPSSDKEMMKRIEKRMKLNDPEAFRRLGVAYQFGRWGLTKNSKKALGLWNKAVELGSLGAHYELARAYHSGQGVEEDMDKAIQHYELAAITGHEEARHMLGLLEVLYGKKDRALKHFIIAARSGYDRSSKQVGEGYKRGYITKDEYASALRAYQVSADKMKSKGRVKATIISEEFKNSMKDQING